MALHRFVCGECHREVSVAPAAIGKQATCLCGAFVTVPTAEQDTALRLQRIRDAEAATEDQRRQKEADRTRKAEERRAAKAARTQKREEKRLAKEEHRQEREEKCQREERAREEQWQREKRAREEEHIPPAEAGNAPPMKSIKAASELVKTAKSFHGVLAVIGGIMIAIGILGAFLGMILVADEHIPRQALIGILPGSVISILAGSLIICVGKLVEHGAVLFAWHVRRHA